MRWTKIIFWAAAVYGIAVLVPGIFMEASLKPPLSHPEFYYGFYGVALVFQGVFILIARDPARYRPLIWLAIFEKAAFFVPTMILWMQGRLSAGGTLIGAAIDGVLMVLFSSALIIGNVRRQHSSPAELTGW